MAKTLHLQSMGPRFDPWSGNEIPHAATKTQCSQIKQIKDIFKKIPSSEDTLLRRRSFLKCLVSGY